MAYARDFVMGRVGGFQSHILKRNRVISDHRQSVGYNCTHAIN